MEALAFALLLAAVNKGLLDVVASTLRRRWPEIDLWYFDLVALATGAIIAWVGGANLFADLIANQLTARILTCLLVGGGANLINSIFSNVSLRGASGMLVRSSAGPTIGRRICGW